MIASSPAFKRISAVCLIAALGACSQANGPADNGAAAAVDEDSPAYQAYEYRHGLMHVIVAKMDIVGDMAKGDAPVDEAKFRKASTDLAALSTMVLEGFPQGSGNVDDSRALPEIWENWDDFQAKVRDFENATADLADSAASGGFAAGKPKVKAVGDSCGGCHREYREKRD